MRRTAFGFIVVALLLAASPMVAPGWRAVRAQEASPVVAEEMLELPPGVALAVLTQLAPVELPAAPAALGVIRLTLEPGAEIPPHPHPGLEIVLIETGSVSVRVVEGPAILGVRAGAEAGAAPDTAGPGEELTAAAGDIGIVPAGNVSDARAGEEGATILVFEFAAEATAGTPEA